LAARGFQEEVTREEDRIPPIKSKTFIDKPNERSILKDDNWERCEKKENGDERGAIKMKKTIFVLSLFLSIITFSFRLTNAQKNTDLSIHSKESQNGLEVYDYKKVNIRVMGLDEDAKRIGLTREKIELKCWKRLKQAGLEPAIRISPYLGVFVNVVGSCFHLSIQFKRNIFFIADDDWYQIVGATWSCEMNGEHGGGPESIIGAVDECLDKFLTEYLKANLK
jgi:hypothetical protein